MAVTQLNTTTNSGEQSAIQSPQPATGTAGGTQSSGVQPGTANRLLTSDQGVPLRSSVLTTVNLGATTATEARVTQAPVPSAKQQLNPALLGLVVVFCLVAVVLFWVTSRSAKTTTNYS